MSSLFTLLRRRKFRISAATIENYVLLSDFIKAQKAQIRVVLRPHKVKKYCRIIPLQRVLARLALIPLLSLIGFSPVFAQIESNTISIGIISPKEGSRLSAMGGAHEDAIRLAFSRLGPIRVGDKQINLQLIGWNDRGDPTLASELALQLATEQNVVAILGPLNSASTMAALNSLKEGGLSLPVISMSSAPALLQSGQRDPNFFRLTIDSTQRMSAYATYIEEQKRGQSNQTYLFLYENDVYGRGLSEALSNSFYTSNVVSQSWCSALNSACDNSNSETVCSTVDLDCDDAILQPESYALVEAGEYFRQPFLDLIEEREIQNVVLLGTNQGVLAFALGLEKLNRRLEYFTTGNTKQLFDELPTGTTVISPPNLDPERAPTTELYSQWRNILTEFEQTYARDGADFLSPAYESGMVMHSALQSYLRDKTELPPVEEIRQGLLNVLETQTFDALEPWRRIRFSDGGLDQLPTAPIYRIARSQIREDSVTTQQWVEIEVFPQFNYLESPIKARFTSYSANSATVALSRIEDGVAVLEEVKNIDFLAGEANVDFHVFKPGLFRVSVEGVAYSPAMAETRVVVSPVYLIAALTALVGALIVVSRDLTPIKNRIGRSMLGVLAGVMFTFISLYGRAVSDWFPFPSFGEEAIINALVMSLIGGLLGPHLLPEISVAWGSALTDSFKRKNSQQRRRSDGVRMDLDLSNELPSLNPSPGE